MSDKTKISAAGGQTKISATGGQTKFSVKRSSPREAGKGGKRRNAPKRGRSEPGRRHFLKRALMAGAALALPGITGCDSMLAEDPRGHLSPSKFFTSASEAEQAVLGIYGNMYNRADFGRDFLIVGDWGVDLFHPAARIVSRWSFLLTYSMNANNVQVMVDNWREYYQAVGDANLAISRISKMETIDPQFQAQLVGEAKFFRALYYYYLTNLWGDVPLWLDELALQEVRGLPRTPVNEVRAQIIKDLEAAEKALPSTYDASNLSRATKWAAKTLMVKTYLHMNDWPKARDKAREIVDTSPHRLLDDHAAVFDHNNEFNDEIIFQVSYLDGVQNISRGHRFTPRQQDEPEIEGVNMGGFGFYNLFPSFADSFADNDRRKEGSVATEIQGVKLNWIYMPKWWDITSPRPNRGFNFIVFRLADVYLMLAEAENEVNGPTSLAYEGINTVRTRAGLQPLAGQTQGQFRKALQQERAWELGSEGHRRWDLNRWGRLVEAVQSIDDFPLNPKAAANIQPHQTLFPIPPQEIARNPNLTQNPGY